MPNIYDPVELLRAIHRAEIEDLKAMIADGADLNAQSNEWSPAMQACADGQLKALRLLIAAGADVNARGERGMTPLMIAAEENDEACLAALLKAKADLEVLDDHGRSALGYAAGYGSAECVERLLKAGARIEEPSLQGWGHASCAPAIEAERARREAKALAKATPKAKAAGRAPRV